MESNNNMATSDVKAGRSEPNRKEMQKPSLLSMYSTETHCRMGTVIWRQVRHSARLSSDYEVSYQIRSRKEEVGASPKHPLQSQGELRIR